jgi:hypothetical protein
LFGEEFSRAYEAQLKQLKAQQRSDHRSPSKTPQSPDA